MGDRCEIFTRVNTSCPYEYSVLTLSIAVAKNQNMHFSMKSCRRVPGRKLSFSANHCGVIHCRTYDHLENVSESIGANLRIGFIRSARWFEAK